MSSGYSMSLFSSKEDRDATLGSGTKEGANESCDRLAEYLAQRLGGN